MAQDENDNVKGSGLSDEEIVDEVRKMLDGDDKPKNAAQMSAAEGFALVTAPDAVARGLRQRKMVGYVIVMVNEDMQSLACHNIGHGLPTEIRSTIMAEVVCGLEVAKLRLLVGSV